MFLFKTIKYELTESIIVLFFIFTVKDGLHVWRFGGI